MTLDSEGSWSYDTAQNVIIFGVDNCSPSHVDNHKKNFLLLEDPTFGINESFGSLEQAQNLVH